MTNDFPDLQPQRAEKAHESAFTVYYDGACPLCSKEIAVYRRAEGSDAMHWVDAAHCEQQDLGTGLSSDAALARMHVRDEQGRLISGAAAFAAILKRLKKTRWLGRILGLRPVLFVLEPSYTAFLKIRPLWRRRVKAGRSAP